MGRYSNALPELDTDFADLGKSLSGYEKTRGESIRNALAEEQLKDLPQEREWRNKQRSALEEQREYEKGQRPMKEKRDVLQFKMDVGKYIKDRLEKIQDVNGYNGLLQELDGMKMDTSEFPRQFESPEQFQSFLEKAKETASEKLAKLQQGHSERMQKEGFRHSEELHKQTEEGASRRESSAERRHRETLEAQKANRPLIETEEEGFQPPESAIGKKSPQWKRDQKLTAEAQARAKLLETEYADVLKRISDPLTRPGVIADAKKRKAEIENEMQTLTGGKARTQAPAPSGDKAAELGALFGSVYAQGKTPSPKLEAQVHAFLAKNPDAGASFWQAAEKSSNGKLKANGTLKGGQVPTQAPVATGQPPNAIGGGEVSVNPTGPQNVPTGLPTQLPGNALVKPRSLRTGPDLSIW